MIIEVLILGLLLLVALLGVWQRRRRRQQLRRFEDRSHRLYMRTKRDVWIRRWLYGARVKRLTDQRHAPVPTDQTL